MLNYLISQTLQYAIYAYIGVVWGVNVGIYYMAYMECLGMEVLLGTRDSQEPGSNWATGPF